VKKLIVIVLAMVLVAAGLGGFAYAQVNGHEPMTGQKLVGHVVVGKIDLGEVHTAYHGAVTLVNPDCVAEITIERMFIIDEEGSVVYDGPFLRSLTDNPLSPPEIMERPMRPHEVWECFLFSCIPDGEGGWLPFYEVLDSPRTIYKVEIFWSGHKKGCPLSGGIAAVCQWVSQDGQVLTEALAVVPMERFKQRLKPK
jgi:hypothetical protein